jgi:hypothetical protein
VVSHPPEFHGQKGFLVSSDGQVFIFSPENLQVEVNICFDPRVDNSSQSKAFCKRLMQEGDIFRLDQNSFAHVYSDDEREEEEVPGSCDKILLRRWTWPDLDRVAGSLNPLTLHVPDGEEHEIGLGIGLDFSTLELRSTTLDTTGQLGAIL